MRGRRGQGALEYLILLGVALAIVSVVVVFSTGVMGGEKKSAQLDACRQAASVCYTSKLAYPAEPCSQCDTACLSSGKDILSGATGCGLACTNCKAGATDLIYEGAYYSFLPTDRDSWTASDTGWQGYKTTVYPLNAISPANIGTKSVYTTVEGSGFFYPNMNYTISGELGNLSKRRYLVFWISTNFTASSTLFSVILEAGPSSRYKKDLTISQAGAWHKFALDVNTDMTTEGTPNPESITHIVFQLNLKTCLPKYAWVMDNIYFSAARETSAVIPPPQAACADSTLYNQCSLTKPLYCENGVLSVRCTTCGCDTGYKCCANQACVLNTVQCPGGCS